MWLALGSEAAFGRPKIAVCADGDGLQEDRELGPRHLRVPSARGAQGSLGLHHGLFDQVQIAVGVGQKGLGSDAHLHRALHTDPSLRRVGTGTECVGRSA